MREPKFPIGTVFKTRHKHPRTCTVIDIYRTFNSAGEQVDMRYVTTHEFLGQILTDTQVPETAIQLGTVISIPE
jgi:hypothetical protein